jgi:hypothetical protein
MYKLRQTGAAGKKSCVRRGNAPKDDENWSKIRNFDRFYGFTSKTYGESRSVGSFTALPTDRAQNLVFGRQQGREFGRPSGRHATN